MRRSDYADSAQARELDQQRATDASYHDEVGAEAFAAQCLVTRLREQSASRARVKAAMAKIEMIFGERK
jgi:hypothetical protein